VTYEKLGEAEIAAAEYVKLAYKFPDSEYIGVAMARLGFHFLRGAMKKDKEFKAFVKKNKLEEALLAKRPPDDIDRAKYLDAKDMQKSLFREYQKGGKILRRVIERFPSHELATKCGLTAGHCYRKGNQPETAVLVYKKIYKNKSYDTDSRAQAMYWVGKIFLKERNMMGAYSTLMLITIDFPESSWAANARAELAKPHMITLDTELQLKRAEGAK
jgi:tetratricopeptide (TPR) repeat protein